MVGKTVWFEEKEVDCSTFGVFSTLMIVKSFDIQGKVELRPSHSTVLSILLIGKI